MEANKGKFFYWLIASSLLLLGYRHVSFPEHQKIPHVPGQSIPVSPSVHQNHSLKYTAEAASFEGITISGRSSGAEDKTKPYAKYITFHPGFDAHAQLASVYIHRFLTQAYFTKVLYLFYCVLLI